MQAVKTKMVSDALDYGFDWTKWLENEDTLADAIITCADPTLTIGNTYFSGAIVKSLLSAGELGKSYVIICSITTTGGLSASSSGTLLITNKAR